MLGIANKYMNKKYFMNYYFWVAYQSQVVFLLTL